MRLRDTVLTAFLLLTIAGFAFLSIYLLMPPSPVPATAPSTDFSAARAMQHVNQIAKEPHAMGTAAHADVRTYLLQQMKQLGLEPQVQEATVVEDQRAGYVYNLIGRLKGTGNGSRALLVMAHYDSQPNTRGAADDGAGVAAILETIRALKQSQPLQHDVIVLLTDGEEYGLFGARAFLEHPWIKDVALVLNVEARGNEGPSMTFELSPENGWLAKQYSQAAPYPYISSMAYEVYRRMPNDTDFTIFRKAGYRGLNSAFIDGFVHYHKLTDSPENLHKGSLQQHGSNMLALVRHFGTIDLTATKAPDTVFFNFIGKWVINYPVWLNLVWVLLTLVLIVMMLRLVVRKGLATGGQLMVGASLPLLWLLLTGVVIYLLNMLVVRLLPYAHAGNGVYYTHAFLVGYLLVAFGLFIWFAARAGRRKPVFGLVAGSLAGQVPPMLVLYLLVPAASYLVVFPLLFSVAGYMIILHRELFRPGRLLVYCVVALFAALPAIFLLMPVVQVLFIVFSLTLPVAAVIVFVILLTLLLPLLVAVRPENYSRMIPALSLLAGVTVLVVAIIKEQPSPETPLHSHTAYYLNADNNTAYWVSNYAKTDDWNRQFFTDPRVGALTEMYPHAQRIVIKNDAQPVTLPAPVAEVISDSVYGDERKLRLHVASPRGAAHLEVVLQPGTADTLKAVFLNGKQLALRPLPTQTTPVYSLRYYGLPLAKNGILEVHLKKGVPLTLLLYDHSLSLPQALIKQPVPAYIVPEQGRDSNLTVIRKSYSF